MTTTTAITATTTIATTTATTTVVVSPTNIIYSIKLAVRNGYLHYETYVGFKYASQKLDQLQGEAK